MRYIGIILTYFITRILSGYVLSLSINKNCEEKGWSSLPFGKDIVCEVIDVRNKVKE